MSSRLWDRDPLGVLFTFFLKIQRINNPELFNLNSLSSNFWIIASNLEVILIILTHSNKREHNPAILEKICLLNIIFKIESTTINKNIEINITFFSGGSFIFIIVIVKNTLKKY